MSIHGWFFRKKLATTSVITGLDPVIHTVFYLRMRRFWVYILAGHKNGTLYTGVTNNLSRRLYQHQQGTGSKFTQKYRVKRLVWYEEHATAERAISREKAIKHWSRAWKIELIEATNPEWFDLGKDLNR
ncbi:GIY-YIG nuclease superfamily protein [Roseibium alexandrii]|uniref:GIY-YIG nuclease superfamily protein n=2 Tax=Roseibium alexandrii TaxID=388408 RepID=A0A0M6ZX31_9HYPH|nr:GIY-YIG nuclease superfamily protein [Roseibium alexandrii]